MWLEAILEIKILPENNAEIVWSWNLKDHLIQDEFPDALNYGDVSAHPGKVDFNYISSEVNQESETPNRFAPIFRKINPLLYCPPMLLLAKQKY